MKQPRITPNQFREMMGFDKQNKPAELGPIADAIRGVAAERDRQRLARIKSQMQEHGGVDSDDIEWLCTQTELYLDYADIQRDPLNHP